MRRLNFALMVVLTIGIFVAAGYLALNGNHKNKESRLLADRYARLLRKLGDEDPDLRREAKNQLRGMGVHALPILREAAESEDSRLAEEATALLDELAPPVRFTLERPDPQVLRFRVQIINDARKSVLLAQDPVGRYARLEATSPAGETFYLSLEAEGSPEPKAGVVSIPPGQTFDLFAGTGNETIAPGQPFPGRGTWKIRFAYDATEESAYRKQVRSMSNGLPLPAEILFSNEVSIEIVE